MRRLVLALALAACGKTGDARLSKIPGATRVEIHDHGVVYDLDRHAGKGFAVRTSVDVERVDASWVSEAVVDRFLGGVAAGGRPIRDEKGTARARIWPRGEADSIAVDLVGDEEGYEAMLTSIGRRALP